MLFKMSLEAANPQLTPKQLQAVATQEWLKLSNSERRKFTSEADKLMAKYRQDCITLYLEQERTRQLAQTQAQARERKRAKTEKEGEQKVEKS